MRALVAVSTRSPATNAEWPSETHHRALRALDNRFVGILYGCLRNGALYDDHIAWGHRITATA